MSLYDAFKDVIKTAQKADNIELYRQLLDLSSQALDLQAENARLKEENAVLRKRKDNEDRIVRHRHPYITLLGDEQQLKYCAVCWDSEKNLIQMLEYSEWTGSDMSLHCIKCKNHCRVDS